jgi:hypothetical protein
MTAMQATAVNPLFSRSTSIFCSALRVMRSFRGGDLPALNVSHGYAVSPAGMRPVLSLDGCQSELTAKKVLVLSTRDVKIHGILPFRKIVR